jgi:hypothetical protein
MQYNMLHISRTNAPLAFQQWDIVDSGVIPLSFILLISYLPDDIVSSVQEGFGFVPVVKGAHSFTTARFSARRGFT